MLSKRETRTAEVKERLHQLRLVLPRPGERNGVVVSDPNPAKFDRITITRYSRKTGEGEGDVVKPSPNS